MPYKDAASKTAWSRRYYAANRERVLAIKRAWIERNPEKRKAQVAVSNALRDGRLKRQPCEVCGAEAQAHHDDYTRRLDVRWLCVTHHKEAHRVLT